MSDLPFLLCEKNMCVYVRVGGNSSPCIRSTQEDTLMYREAGCYKTYSSDLTSDPTSDPGQSQFGTDTSTDCL